MSKSKCNLSYENKTTPKSYIELVLSVRFSIDRRKNGGAT